MYEQLYVNQRGKTEIDPYTVTVIVIGASYVLNRIQGIAAEGILNRMSKGNLEKRLD